MPLTKGLEEEVYTGLRDATVVGLSDQVKAALDGFHTEPDNRNTEFATEPHRDYEALKAEFMGFRLRLREFIRTLGDYVLIPGGALSLGDTGQFHFSDPENPYYRYIRDAYGTDVVTASTHVSIGVDPVEDIMRVARVVRMDGAMYLAMTAASPWLDGQATGFHSTRWERFPRTPAEVPLFADHPQYAAWMEDKLATGEMQNSRHLWLAARPNGHLAPHDLNRVELRICDRISHPDVLLGVVSMLEARILQVLDTPGLDPLAGGTMSETDLVALAAANEAAVSRSSTDAVIRRWTDGRELPVRAWIEETREAGRPYARGEGFASYLAGLDRVIERGSIAKRWLAREAAGESIRSILADAIEDSEVCDLTCCGNSATCMHYDA